MAVREYASAKYSIPTNSSRWISVTHSSYDSNSAYTRLGAIAAHVGDESTGNPNDCSIVRFSDSGLRIRNESGKTVSTTTSKDGASSKGDIAPFIYTLYVRKDICKSIM